MQLKGHTIDYDHLKRSILYKMFMLVKIFPEDTALMIMTELAISREWQRLYRQLRKYDTSKLISYERAVIEDLIKEAKAMRNKEAFLRLREVITRHMKKFNIDYTMEKYNSRDREELKTIFISRFLYEHQLENMVKIEPVKIGLEDGVAMKIGVVFGEAKSIFNDMIRAIALNEKELDDELKAEKIPDHYRSRMIEILRSYYPTEESLQIKG